MESSPGTTACEKCGTILRAPGGTCLACFMSEGLASEGEASRDAFQSVLIEDDIPDRHWYLGQYEILEEIGRGGMGVIYRARQRHSRRIVALKRIFAYQVNASEALLRFRREAEAAAALDHPNILPIYEVSESEDGLPFFSMKYATRGSLRTAAATLRTQPRECARLVAKVARAMGRAHAQGIVHRDLQPGNILLDANGEPLVTDFGLAKWMDGDSDLTRTRTTFGTPGYIAPEQAECTADELAPASDIYSLGAVLFFLLAGRAPFVGASVLSVIHQAAATTAPKLRTHIPSIDRDLETIVARCLEREPAARYASADALAQDLERWLVGRSILARPVGPPIRAWRWARRNPVLASATVGCLILAGVVIWLLSRPGGQTFSEKSIAVLPFKNLSDDPNQAYFADGITDEILTRLSRIGALKVISRGSTQTFKDAPINAREVGRQLGVAHVLEGSVRKSSETVRVTVRLTNTQSNAEVWAETYDRKIADMFQVETEVAQRIATTLEATLNGAEERALADRPTANVEAYREYLQGRFFWNKRTQEGFRAALPHLRRALELDPGYAQAQVGLADAIIFRGGHDLATHDAAMQNGRALLQQALAVDDTLAEAHASLGLLAMNYDWDWVLAEKEFKRAIALNPNYATAHHWFGEFLAYMGRFDEATAQIHLARELDPLSLIINTDVAKVYCLARRYDDAIAQFQVALRLDPNFAEAHALLGMTLSLQGRHDEAVAELRKVEGLESNPAFLCWLGYVYAKAGKEAEARQIVEAVRELAANTYVSPLWWVTLWIGIGDHEEAFRAFERVLAERPSGGPVTLKVNPFFDSLREDPRYADLLRRAGFSP